MKYTVKLKLLLQAEDDAKNDFEKILFELLEKGYSYRDLADYLLRFPETLIKPKTV